MSSLPRKAAIPIEIGTGTTREPCWMANVAVVEGWRNGGRNQGPRFRQDVETAVNRKNCAYRLRLS
jgi:hypothetical protein